MKNLNKEEILRKSRESNVDEWEENLENKSRLRGISFAYIVILIIEYHSAFIVDDRKVFSAVFTIMLSIDVPRNWYRYKYENNKKYLIYLVLQIITIIFSLIGYFRQF